MLCLFHVTVTKLLGCQKLHVKTGATVHLLCNFIGPWLKHVCHLQLEYINDEVWANVWMTECIAKIDPRTGNIRCCTAVRFSKSTFHARSRQRMFCQWAAPAMVGFTAQ